MFSERGLDIASIIALWLAVHGGDASMADITVDDWTSALIGAALDSHLSYVTEFARRGGTSPAQLEERLGHLGLTLRPRRPDDNRYTFSWQVPGQDADRPETRTLRVCVPVRPPRRAAS
jgi:hypothetical protein